MSSAQGRVNANDIDTVGEISFSTNSNLISVAEDSGDVILIQSLDFEDGFQLRLIFQEIQNFQSPIKTEKFYEIPIFVSDGRKVGASIQLNIIDANDNTPKFDKIEYNFQISEDAAFNTTIGKISATDLDTTSLEATSSAVNSCLLPRRGP